MDMDNEKQFAIKLADNEKKVRDKSLSMLRNYITARSKTEQGFKKKVLMQKKIHLIFKDFTFL
jgi:hypothetical protein